MYYKNCLYVVRAMPIARQRVAKHVPAEEYRGTIGRQFLGNGAATRLRIVERRCFPWGPCKVDIRESSSEAVTDIVEERE
jgi:hypothetical protein